MRIPPIVGVPAFERWERGPSSRTDCPIWRRFRRRIVGPPSASAIRSAVTAAIAVRKVMYRKTLNAGKNFASG